MKKAAHADVWLLDANVLIALTHAAHVHHAEAHEWFAQQPDRRWASCALTQLAFVRLTSNPRVVGMEIPPLQALAALEDMTASPAHEYWDDAPEPRRSATLNHPAMAGHRQVTDAYLLELAARRGQRLATLDRGLVSFARALGLGLAQHLEFVAAPLMPGAYAVHEPTPVYRVDAPAGKASRRG
jgi:toxin-antitoxin system PIN domain toxin